MPRRANPKIDGERAECVFMGEAMGRGFIVSKPYGDSAPYDFVVQRRVVSPQPSATRKKRRGIPSKPKPGDPGLKPRATGGASRGARLWRVQVKAVLRQQACGGYAITTCHGSRRPYTRQEIDFFVAWVVPVDAWYVIPIEEVGTAMAAGLYPHVKGTRSKYEKYREAWRLLG